MSLTTPDSPTPAPGTSGGGERLSDGRHVAALESWVMAALEVLSALRQPPNAQRPGLSPHVADRIWLRVVREELDIDALRGAQRLLDSALADDVRMAAALEALAEPPPAPAGVPEKEGA